MQSESIGDLDSRESRFSAVFMALRIRMISLWGTGSRQARPRGGMALGFDACPEAKHGGLDH